MTQEPIEITAKEIIKRPDNLSLGTKSSTSPGANQGGGFKLGDIKGYMKQIKEVIDLARELGVEDMLAEAGINLPGLKKGGKTQEQSTDLPAPKSQADQFKAFLKLLQMHYGDVTVDELIGKLKAEFGKKRISQIGK